MGQLEDPENNVFCVSSGTPSGWTVSDATAVPGAG